MADFVIRMPRLSVASAAGHLQEVLVPDGGVATEGEPLFVVEAEKVENEVPAGASGTVHWTAAVGQEYEVGTEIGVIFAPIAGSGMT